MIQEDAGSKPRSPSGERDRRNKKAMKIQPQSGQRPSPASSSSSPGRRAGQSEEDSETEGEFSPANSGVDPNFLRKIQKSTELSKIDQEVSEGDCDCWWSRADVGPGYVQVVRLIGQHLCDVGLRTSADVLMKEAGCRLDQPTAATFRHCVMKGDWTGAVNVLEDLAG